jgi:heme-degrading monooxygenase HmoA
LIARQWRCSASSEKVSDYVEHFQHSVLPELNQLQGFREAYILRRNQDDGVEITVITLWESMDAIRIFAGDNVETAVVEPAAQAVLRTFDMTVTHFEVVVNAGRKALE